MSHICKKEGQKSGLDTESTQTKTESHGHTLRFSYKSDIYTLACNAPMTIQQSLQKDSSFRAICKKEGNKEMIIRREDMPRGAVAPHFPCSLLNDNERLDISFIRSGGNSSTMKTPLLYLHPPENLLCFYIRTRGDKNIRVVMKNNELNKKNVDYVCVYAVKGEKVKSALKRDGRFDDVIFSKGALTNEETSEKANLSTLVDHLDGKQFQIIVSSHQSDSQELSQEAETVKQEQSEDTETLQENPNKESNSADDQQRKRKQKETEMRREEKKSRKYPEAKVIPNTQEIQNLLRKQHIDLLKTLKQRENLKSNVEIMSFSIKEIPNSEEILSILKDQHRDLVKMLKEQENLKNDGEVKRFFRVEYDKSVQSFSEVKRVEELIKLSRSVCQIRIDGSPKGTGFLLFKRFVLTNAHVVKDLFPFIPESLHNLTAVFRFEDLKSKVNERKIKQVVACSFEKGDMGNHLDFALLELSSDVKFPELIRCYSPPPIRGGVCIIGHPDGGVKRMDLCFIITKENVQHEAARHCENNPNIHVINERCLAENWEVQESQISYNSCFFHGSSGSPVFDECCKLIGVHTGGYVYPGESGETRSVMEYGFPLFPILKQILIQCHKNGRSDVVQDFLASSNLKLIVNKAEEQLKREHQAN